MALTAENLQVATVEMMNHPLAGDTRAFIGRAEDMRPSTDVRAGTEAVA